MHLEAGFLFTFAFMKITHEKACLCALNNIFGFEPKIALALISHFGSASEIFRLSPHEQELLLGPHSKYRGRITVEAADRCMAELEELAGKGISFIGWSESAYPHMLKECEDAPAGLYIKSRTAVEKLWNARRFISIVGTRDISTYGREWCERIVRCLAESSERDRPVIISGLALGTDTCAHRTALASGLATAAVMATGPDIVYPSRNIPLADSMCRSEGSALITDYPPGTAPLAVHFLRRNRIIAGLSEATILIESKIKGGGMMTARLADSYNRTVFALPGRVDDLRSQGCNLLIRNRTAIPISSIEDLLKELGLSSRRKTAREPDMEKLKRLYYGTIPDDRISQMGTILLAIRRERGISAEEIAGKTGLEYLRVSQLLGMLENDGIITRDLLQRCFINFAKQE